ncbi:hypothetical protein ACLOJK_019083 [Asimina triloba]
MNRDFMLDGDWGKAGGKNSSSDIAFFDIETNTGEVVGRMSGDTILIQDAVGEKALELNL